jgi:hypothetical protein
MKTSLALVTMVLLLSACAAAPTRLQGDLLGIGGVLIGDSPATVSSRLGRPASQEPQTDFVTLIYRYDGFEVGFSDEAAVDLKSKNSKVCTTEGLCPGDSHGKMLQLYGQPEVADRETGRFYEYYTRDSTCWYQIAETRSTVSSVAVVCQP